MQPPGQNQGRVGLHNSLNDGSAPVAQTADQ
jgi:hypothetical protein